MTTRTLMKILSLTVCTFALNASASDCKSDANYAEVTKAELQKLVDQKAVFVVDVNSKESFDKTHVPGAIHFGSHENDFIKMLPAKKDALIVAYCGGPQCTAWRKAAIEACKAGYTRVKHFKGGIKGWVEKG